MSNNLLGLIASVAQGLDDGVEDFTSSYMQKRDYEQKLAAELAKKEAEEEDLISALDSLNNKRSSSYTKNIADRAKLAAGKLGLYSSDYDQILEQDLNLNKLARQYNKKHGLKDTQKELSATKSLLETWPTDKLIDEFGADIVSRSFKERRPDAATTANEIVDIVEAERDSQKTNELSPPSLLDKINNISSDLLNVVAKTPTRTARGLINLADFISFGNLSKTGLPQKIREATDFIDNKVIDSIAPDTNTIGPKTKSLLEIGADLAVPGGPIKVGSKIGGALTKLPLLMRGGKKSKAILQNAAIAGIESDEDNIGRNALLGGAIGGAGQMLAQGLSNKIYKNISKGANKLLSKEEILERAKLLGPKASIPEIVGNQAYIERAKKTAARGANSERYLAMQKNVGDISDNIVKQLPLDEQKIFYQNILNQKQALSKNANALYSQLGDELSVPQLQKMQKALKETALSVKNIPKLKPHKGNIDNKYFKDLATAIGEMKYSSTARGSMAQYAKNYDVLPSMDEVLKFRRRIQSMIKNDPSNNALINLSREVDSVLSSEKPGALAKANEFYAKNVAPFTTKAAEDALTATKLGEKTPNIAKLFNNDSPETRKLFDLLPMSDKERVLGAILNDILNESEISSPRALKKLWNSLPDHIKTTSDPKMKKLLGQIKNIAKVNNTLSSLQQTSNQSIGSRSAVNKLTSNLRRTPFVADALIAGTLGTTMGAETVPIYLAGKGAYKLGRAAQNKIFNNIINSKNLEKYLEAAKKASDKKK